VVIDKETALVSASGVPVIPKELAVVPIALAPNAKGLARFTLAQFLAVSVIVWIS
jgi:hypothetical protein